MTHRDETYSFAKHFFYISPEMFVASSDYGELQSAILSIVFSVLENPPPLIQEVESEKLLKLMAIAKKKIQVSNSREIEYRDERLRFVEYLTGQNNAYLSVTSKIISYLSYETTGYITILLDDNDWDENVSAKTINKIPLSSVKFPYDSFAIDSSKYAWTISGKNFDTIIVTLLHDSEQILIYVGSSDEDGISRMFMFPIFESIDDMMENSIEKHNQDELTFLIGRILSVSMYMENFKKEPSRVIRATKKIKKNKKKGIAKDSLIRTIRLKQPEYTYEVSSSDLIEEKTENAKAFVVRGHWRNQSHVNEDQVRYNKPKWIDPYVKGSGKEFFKKVVKI